MNEKYKSNAQQRILKILVLLGGHEMNGLSPGDIGKTLNISPANVTHDLSNLRIAGLAEQIEGIGTWRLTPRVPQIAIAMLNGISRTKSKLDEVENRYTRQIF